MTHHRRTLAVALSVIAAFILVSLLVIVTPGLRALAARGGLALVLSTKSLHLTHVDLAIGRNALDAKDLVITDSSGNPAISARDIAVKYSFARGAVVISSVVVDQPHVVVSREADGSFDLVNAFIPSGGGSRAGSPLLMDIAVRNGGVDIVNRHSPAKAGRLVSVRRVNASAFVRQGGMTRGEMTASLLTGGVPSPIRADLVENDRTKIGHATIHVSAAPLAPVVDLLTSTPSFAVESGSADADAHLFAIGWSDSTGPAWHVAGGGAVHSACLRTLPLAVAVCGVSGPLYLSDGLVMFPNLAATASGIPVRASGTLAFSPGPELGLSVRARGPLSRMRSLLAFSRAMPLHGDVQLYATILGPATNPHADIALRSAGALAYGSFPMTALASNLYYHDGHVVVLATNAKYDGAQIHADGDIDLSASPVSGQFMSLAKVAANRVPILSQLAPTATARVAASFAGPLTQMAGEGFADVRGGRTTIRATVQAGTTQRTFAAIAKDSRGGELFAGAHAAQPAPDAIDANMIARNFELRIEGSPVALPGLSGRTLALPRSRARVDGVASVTGSVAHPSGQVAITASHIAVGAIVGLSSAMVSGLETSSVSGLVRDRDWIGDVSAAGKRMRVAGIETPEIHGIVFGSGERVDAGTIAAQIGGGQATVAGSMPAQRAGGLRVYISDVDASVLRNLGVPLTAGKVTAIASLSGSRERPHWQMQGAISDATMAGHAVAADGIFQYDGNTLRASHTRLSVDGNLAYVDGSAHNLGRRGPASSNVDADVRLPAADLATLSTFSGGSDAEVAGLASATMHVGGSLAAPQVNGSVQSDIGTVRGVTFRNLHATAAGRPDALDIQDAGVQFGGSSLRLAGAVSPSSFALRVVGQHVDLGDFNDFFNGKDVLEGHGSLALDLATGARPIRALGGMRFRDVRIDGVPAGAVDVAISPNAGATSARIVQRSQLSSMNLRADVGFRPSASLFPDFAAAHYTLNGGVRAPDLAAVAPYVGAEDQGIGGSLNASLQARGLLSAMGTTARFDVARFRMRGVAFDFVRADLQADRKRIEVRSLRAAGNRITIAANGRLERSSGRIAARAHADIDDLASLAKLAHVPGSTRGSAVFDLAAGGTLANPVLAARASSARGQMQGFEFDSAALAATYDRGHLGANGRVSLAHQGGAVEAAGSVPVRLWPFSVGPNTAHVTFRGRADGVDLAEIDPLLGKAASLHGKLDGGLAVNGTVGQPVVSGNAQLRNVAIASKFDSVGARDVNGDVAFVGDTISLRSFRARLGDGTLAAHGDAHIVPATRMHPAPNLQFALGATLNNAQFDVPNLVKGNITGKLSLTKSGRVPYLDGNVTLDNTSVPFASILALASGGPSEKTGANIPGVPTPLPGRVVGYAGSIYGGSDFRLVTHAPAHRRSHALLPHKVDLGLRVQARRNVGLTGAIDAQGTGTVAVGGTTRAPKVAGTLTATRGRAGFLNTRVDLNYGTVTFDPADGLLPTIDAAATTSTDSADITITISGRVDQLHTDFSSNPDMPSNAIVASMLHIPQINSALASSHGVEQSQFGVAPQNVVSGVIAGQVLGALNVGLEQLFNVGEVNFQLDQRGQPALELRQQFGPHAYTIYKSTFSVPPAQMFGVAYDIRRALQVEFTQSQSTPGLSPTLAPPQTSLEVKISFH